MSLVIYVTPKTVVISKYQIEFEFQPPPEKLEQAAEKAYRLLRISESLQTASSKAERKEVITLLSHYGFALFKAVIPEKFEQRIYEEGGLFIYARHEKIMRMPWELLFDGNSFLGLTQGVVRICESKYLDLNQTTFLPTESIDLSLNSFEPIEEAVHATDFKELERGNRFINYVEELACGTLLENPRIKIEVNSQASNSSVIKSLEKGPHVFWFSGFETDKGWKLFSPDDSLGGAFFEPFDLQQKLKASVDAGLRILVLATSQLIEEIPPNPWTYYKGYFDCGLPVLISLNGRIGRKRIKRYFDAFFTALAKGDNILKAHRQAINGVCAELTSSWDWSWIQLWINQNMLESLSRSPLESFILTDETPHSGQSKYKFPIQVYSSHRFEGNAKAFQEFQTKLEKLANDAMLVVHSEQGLGVETYLAEYFRRRLYQSNIDLQILYYQRSETKYPLKSPQLEETLKVFAFLFLERDIERYFDQSLTKLLEGQTGAKRYLIVENPPTERDTIFENWLTQKRSRGWTVIFIEKPVSPGLRLEVVSVDQTGLQDLLHHFEDEIPESWDPLLKDPLGDPLTHTRLLKLILRLKDPVLIEKVVQEEKPAVLWRKSWHKLLSSLSAMEVKILLACHYLRVMVKRDLLTRLLSAEQLDSKLERLVDFGVLTSDLNHSSVKMSKSIRDSFSPGDYIKPAQLSNFLKNLVQSMIKGSSWWIREHHELLAGFQYLTSELVTLGSIETGIFRNLQLAERFSMQFDDRTEVPMNLIRSALYWASISQRASIYEKTVIRALEVLEGFAFEQQVIRLYEWRLKQMEEKKDWMEVSSLQMKIAGLYSKINQNERALGLLTSAIFLNNDIRNEALRTANKVDIALLFLEMEEYARVKDLIDGFQFDFKGLNEETAAKLWLIDAHLLFHAQKYLEALDAFSKSWEKTQNTVTPNLLGKSYHLMAKINQELGNEEANLECLIKAAEMFERSRRYAKASDLHKRIGEKLCELNKNTEATPHFEWLFRYWEKKNELERLKKIANQLGGLYYQMNEKERSMKFYKIAEDLHD